MEKRNGSKNNSSLSEQYLQRYSSLKNLADDIEIHLKEVLKTNISRIDRISVRAKDVSSFLGKAKREGKEYENPLQDIQDQVGARIIVKFLSDIKIIEEAIKLDFVYRENTHRESEKNNQFGYEAQHIICTIPLDMREKYKIDLAVFEIQISTLFQHSWAEANHDIGYKANKPISGDIERKMAWLAAQAWGADRILDEIYQEQNLNNNSDSSQDNPQSSL